MSRDDEESQSDRENVDTNHPKYVLQWTTTCRLGDTRSARRECVTFHLHCILAFEVCAFAAYNS